VLGDALILVLNLNRSVVFPVTFQLAITSNQSISSVVLLAEAPTIENSLEEPEKVQVAASRSNQLALAGSQVIAPI